MGHEYVSHSGGVLGTGPTSREKAQQNSPQRTALRNRRFRRALEGLCIAEAEFDSAADADALTIPSFILAEVTTDDRFTGGEIVRSSRHEIQGWLSEYGIRL